MSKILAFLVMGICFFIFTATSYIWVINQARRRGLLSMRKPTLEDVKRLLKIGEKPMAIELYREIYGLSRAQSEKEIDLLGRNLEKHDQEN